MSTELSSKLTSVYGPVKSWRYGRSLGIDPIGLVSTCSFNCVYCQLGEIEHKTSDRAIFIPTEQILQDLQHFAPWDVDIITLSGSGEPTLAFNLGEILTSIKQITHRPILVLTNGSLLSDPAVRQELALADTVSVKLDAISAKQLQRIDRPVSGIDFGNLWAGIQQFSQQYCGQLSIQTMILKEWSDDDQGEFINLMQILLPDEIHLNTPTRPKPLKRQLDGRENHTKADSRPYPVQVLKCVRPDVLQKLATQIQCATGIPVRHTQA